MCRRKVATRSNSAKGLSEEVQSEAQMTFSSSYQFYSPPEHVLKAQMAIH